MGIITATLGSLYFGSSEPEPEQTARSDSGVVEYEAQHNFVLIRPRLDALQLCLCQADIKNSDLPLTNLLEKSHQDLKRHHSCLILPL